MERKETSSSLLKKNYLTSFLLAGAKLMYLPPYSPDFNPIEKAFSQIKAFLKKTAARTKDKLDAAIADAIDIGSPQNALIYFSACGYESDTV